MRNQAYEQLLESQSVPWEYIEKFPLGNIDQAKSLRNQARLSTPQDEELIESYAAMDKSGLEAPPLVIWRPGKSRWVLIDGNQRLASKLKNGRETTDVYTVLSVDPQVIDRLTWTWNNLVNGRRITQEEAMEHAVSYVQKYGVGISVAAKEWGVNPSILQQRIKIEECRRVLESRNVRLPSPVADSTIRQLAPLLTIGEDLFCSGVMAVSSSGATVDDTEDLVRNVKRAKTVEDKSKVIDEFINSEKAEERRAETKGGKIAVKRNLPREKFFRLLRDLRNLTDDYEAIALRPAGSLIKDAKEMAADVVRRLTLMFSLGEVPVQARVDDKTEVG